MKSILDYIKVFKNIETYKGPGPRNMAHGGRIGLKNGTKKRELFDLDVKGRKPNATGGRVSLSSGGLAGMLGE